MCKKCGCGKPGKKHAKKAPAKKAAKKSPRKRKGY